GKAGIAIIRISGPQAIEIAGKVFTPYRPRARGGDQPNRMKRWTAKYGQVHNARGEFVDEAIMLVMPGPASYTREDVVEISCHGGTVAAQTLLGLVLEAGARLAEPGEFTKRAFLSGRIDLSQAEAVLEIVEARTDRAQKIAARFLGGHVGRALWRMRDALVDLLTRVEASLDFPEDDVEQVSAGEIGTAAFELAQEVSSALEQASLGRILSEGASVAIIGRPNVGKSSLLNALLREDRAIVAESPGTTRDLVAEVANIRGIPIRLVDTAGLRESDDPVERIGVERARTALSEADVALAVVDRSLPLEDGDVEVIRRTPRECTIVVLNKADLPPSLAKDTLSRFADGRTVQEVSALTGAGIPQLEEAIEEIVVRRGRGNSEEDFAFTSRRVDCLRRAEAALRDASAGAAAGMPLDILAIDLRNALDALGELMGETTREDVVDMIFERFCIGK
ncbi:MAG: tRNA uridine-5-carboxymethylaminomethyl(34) synthesis GTPase MnmE, partial [Firmicutes bacterium]|nr:tRNA uridine-5-carboxymethylaminomethyl(34) synthesis GTPase MnmE [Bacillota bacterium]